MIIKSRSRGNKSFRQLIDYQNDRALEDFVVTKNVPHGAEHDPQSLTQLFDANASHLSARKGGNFLFHEIISIPRTPNLTEHQHAEILMDLTHRYLDRRGDMMAYGRIHMDHRHHAHIHLLLSANEVGRYRRHRFTKFEFAQLQRDLERHLLERYPELGDRPLRRGKRLHKSLTDSEFQLAKRTGKMTKRAALQEELSGHIAASTSAEDLAHRLHSAGIGLSIRGKNITAIAAGGLKARLGKLGLADSQERLRPVAVRMELINERVSQLRRAAGIGAKLAMEIDGPEMEVSNIVDVANQP